ncbi:hypothetical protein NPIL_430941 [Nephila pilipes]|uniref:DUF7041 domain-containing protein n=1 Tax=Nephila pilipes TaxID=299642 RepID=A0A8X6QQ89_NEPPI|nr:hypothetical protein NPIL_430941 [Nephila pilipes]
MTEDSNAQQLVSRVAAKLPPLWKHNIKLWFLQTKANFELSGITNDVTKYNNVLAATDSEILSVVSDLLFDPPHADRNPNTLSVSSEKFENQEKLADKIAEVRFSSFTQNVYAVAGRSEQSSDPPNSPLNEMIALRGEIAA